MSSEATDIERRLLANRDAFVLKEHDIWYVRSVEALFVLLVGHLGVSAGQCASCNNKAFLPIMDSHRVGSGRVLKFGPACNSE